MPIAFSGLPSPIAPTETKQRPAPRKWLTDEHLERLGGLLAKLEGEGETLDLQKEVARQYLERFGVYDIGDVSLLPEPGKDATRQYLERFGAYDAGDVSLLPEPGKDATRQSLELSGNSGRFAGDVSLLPKTGPTFDMGPRMTAPRTSEEMFGNAPKRGLSEWELHQYEKARRAAEMDPLGIMPELVGIMPELAELQQDAAGGLARRLIPGSGPNAESIRDVTEGVARFGSGFVNLPGYIELAKGIVTDPVGTVKGIGQMIAAPFDESLTTAQRVESGLGAIALIAGPLAVKGVKARAARALAKEAAEGLIAREAFIEKARSMAKEPEGPEITPIDRFLNATDNTEPGPAIQPEAPLGATPDKLNGGKQKAQAAPPVAEQAAPPVAEQAAPLGATPGKLKGGKQKAQAAPPVAEQAAPPVTPDTTGLANQVQAREMDILGKIGPIEGKGPGHWQKVGQAAVAAGADYRQLAAEVAEGTAELTGERVGILLEGKRLMMHEFRRLEKAAAESPGNESIRSARDSAMQDLQDYALQVQQGKGRWSDVGRALQAGVDVEFGDYASVIEYAARRNVRPDAKTLSQLQAEVEKVAQKDARITELEAGMAELDAKIAQAPEGPPPKSPRRRFNKADIDAEIADIMRQWKELKPGVGVKGSKQTGAVSRITAKDVLRVKEQAHLVRRLAEAHIKRGAATLEEVYVAVRDTVKAHLGMEIDNDAILEALAIRRSVKLGRKMTATDERLADLRRQARDLSPERIKQMDAKARARAQARKAKVESQIKLLEAQLKNAAEGKPVSLEGIVTKHKLQTTKTVAEQRLADLRAMRDMNVSAIRRVIAEGEKPKLERVLDRALGEIRSVKLGSDLGFIYRQGAFIWNHPKVGLEALGKARRAMFDPVEAEKIARASAEKTLPSGRMLAPIRRKAGLSLTDATISPEELSATQLIKKIPGIGKSAGGALERFQHTFINEGRTGLFDKGVAKGMTPGELELRAKFINNATGRSNLRNVPKVFRWAMTSLRHEASRWGTLAAPVENLYKLGADLATGKGFNKGAIANLQDMSMFVARTALIWKIAEKLGWEVEKDPHNASVWQLRNGDQVISLTAGLDTRLRDTLRVYYAMEDSMKGKTPQHTWQEVLGKRAMDAITPAITTPINVRGKLAAGKDYVSPFTGYKDEESLSPEWELAPLVASGAHQAFQSEGLRAGIIAGVADFFGFGSNIYPKNAKPNFMGYDVDSDLIPKGLPEVEWGTRPRALGESKEDYAARMDRESKIMLDVVKSRVEKPDWEGLTQETKTLQLKAINKSVKARLKVVKSNGK